MKTALITTAAALLLTSVWSASSFAQHYDDEDHGGHHTGKIMIGNPVGTTRKTETKVGSGTDRVTWDQ